MIGLEGWEDLKDRKNWERFGASWECPGKLFGDLWSLGMHLRAGERLLEISLSSFGELLGICVGSLKGSWQSLEDSGVSLGVLSGVCGRKMLQILGQDITNDELEMEIVSSAKVLKKQRFFNYFEGSEASETNLI